MEELVDDSVMSSEEEILTSFILEHYPVDIDFDNEMVILYHKVLLILIPCIWSG